MIVEIQMAYISMTKFTSKNPSEPVFFWSINQKRPVLGGPIQSPKYLGQSRTGCGCSCPIWKSKNQTGLDLQTLVVMLAHWTLGSPSVSTLRQNNPVLPLIVLLGSPTMEEIQQNIKSAFENMDVMGAYGYVLMIDEIAIEACSC